MTKLAVQAPAIHGGPREAEAVQHVPHQGGKTGLVQHVTTEAPVSTEDDMGAVVHLSKQRRNESTFHPSNIDNNKTEHNLNHKNLIQFFLKAGHNLFLNAQSSLNWPLTSTSTDLGNVHYTKVLENFDTFLVSIDTPLYDQHLRSNDL
jgi:hypothetical protein